jgi:alpha-N-arabinofuranosidase
LDVSAALTADKKALTVAVVNPTKGGARLKLNLGSLKLAGQAQTWTIAGDDPMAYNQPGEPRKVDIEETGAVNLADVVSVKPLSITLWKVAIQ